MRGWIAKWLRRREPLGDSGENLAAEYLRGIGFKILERQHSSRIGELDLIARDDDTIVFVEVKTRKSTMAGLPVEAVTPQKQLQITRAALVYLKQNGLLECRTRFDVVAILLPDDSDKPQITHYRNAFEASGHGQMFA